jgi:hypothetical protein
MSDQQKRGFRLPWAPERGADEASVAAGVDEGMLGSAPAAVGDDLGDGPFPRAEAEPAKTADAAPAASDVPDVDAEAEMIDTDSMQARIQRATGDPVWSTTDDATESAEAAAPPEPAERPETPEASAVPEAREATRATKPAATKPDGESRTPRRENPLVAGLVKAMREAAIASRAETTTRLQGEAASRIEAIRAGSTEEAAALRKRVDDDVAGIREWSKIEMARIRAETEHRIEERRADAINENQRHLDAVEQQVEQVQTTVATFEADMDRFFEQLLAEDDPGRLASLAEHAPEPPDLSGELPTLSGWTDSTFAALFTPEPEAADEELEASTAAATDDASEVVDTAPAAEPTDADADPVAGEAEADPVVLQAEDAEEAEAAATEGLDLSTAEEWPPALMAAARRSDNGTEPSDEDGASSRLNVIGLTSVSGISAFKGAIAGLPGVRSVSVSTGERGMFVYAINHEQETDIAAAISGLSAFGAEVTGTVGDSLSVTAHEPAG